MQAIRRNGVAVLLAGGLVCSGAAFADTDGADGTIASITVFSPGSSEFPNRRGSLVIDEGGSETTYSWGGARCNNKDLSDPERSLLIQASTAANEAVVTPTWVSGLGSTRCLVAVTVTRVPPEPSCLSICELDGIDLGGS